MRRGRPEKYTSRSRSTGCSTRASRSRRRRAPPRSSTPWTGCERYISRAYLVAWETDRKMCGIIGVTGIADASRVAYLGLYSLQHRGQESSGIVAVDGEGAARPHRGMGLVSDGVAHQGLGELPGDVAIGHTRYST